MKISEYIEQLESLKKEHGDLEVQSFHLSGTYMVAYKPVAIHLRLLEGRQQKVRKFQSWDPPELKGKHVVEI